MSASRKLYVALAAKYKAMQPSNDDEWRQWSDMVIATATVFANDNSGFDIRKFLSASGFTDEMVSGALLSV